MEAGIFLKSEWREQHFGALLGCIKSQHCISVRFVVIASPLFQCSNTDLKRRNKKREILMQPSKAPRCCSRHSDCLMEDIHSSKEGSWTKGIFFFFFFFITVFLARHLISSRSVEHGVPVVDVPALLDDLALPPDLLVAHPVDHRAPVGPHGVGAAAGPSLVVCPACNV